MRCSLNDTYLPSARKPVNDIVPFILPFEGLKLSPACIQPVPNIVHRFVIEMCPRRKSTSSLRTSQDVM